MTRSLAALIQLAVLSDATSATNSGCPISRSSFGDVGHPGFVVRTETATADPFSHNPLGKKASENLAADSM
jgi:hypothetical protein